jgi:peptide/nickel transport system substrate-binding protein
MAAHTKSRNEHPMKARGRARLGVRLRGLLCLFIALATLSQCKRHSAPAGGDFPRRETLALGGLQWGEPSSFNPLAVNPDWPVKTPCTLLYQSLLVFDPQKGKLQPLLATGYRQLPGAIELTIDARARFSDGTPVTADDVKYTLDLGKTYSSVPQGPLWPYLKEVAIGSAEQVMGGSATAARDSDKVTIVLNPEDNNPLVILDSLQELRIVPRHVIEPLLSQVNGDLAEFLKLRFDKGAVVSGPYQLHSYSSEKIALIRRDDYWGNAAFHDGQLPAPKYIVHPVYKSNDHYSVALQQGRLDMSSAFMPRIWLKRKKGVRSWFDEPPFFVTTGVPMMLINVARAPLGDVAMRRAMALSVNYKDIQELAVSGYSEPLQSGLVLPSGPESRYFSAEDAARFGAGRFDPDAAREELRAAGYQSIFDDDGKLVEMRDRNGTRVPTVYIKSPTGWTDWEAIVRIAVKGMRAVGIDARERFIDASLFWQATTTGDFDLIMKTPRPQPSPAMPWARFESVLTSRGMAPLGEKAYKNEGRFNDPSSASYVRRFDELLDLIPKLTDEAELTAAYRELNALFMQYQPTLPMVYRSATFYQVSTKVWTGFPFASDPYLPSALVGEHLGTEMLWRLTLSDVI